MKKYIYIDGAKRFAVYYFLLAKELNATILTSMPDVLELAKKENIPSIYLSKNPIKFKIEIKKINPECIILRHDTYHPRLNYLAKKIKHSIVVYAEPGYLSIKQGTALRDEIIKGNKRSFLKNLYGLINFHPLFFGKKIIYEDASLKRFFHVLFSKFFWSFEMKHSFCGEYASLICVNNQSSRDVLIYHGVSEEKIKITGAIAEDFTYNESIKSIEQRLSPSEKIDVLIFDDINKGQGRDLYFNKITEIIKKLSSKGYSVVFKVRPHYINDDYSFLEKFCHVDKTIPLSSNTYNLGLIQKSKLVLGVITSLLPLSMFLKIPTGVFSFNHSNQSIFYQEIGIPIIIKDDKDIVHYLSKLNDPQYNKKILEVYDQIVKDNFCFDGLCTKRIVEVINTYCQHV